MRVPPRKVLEGKNKEETKTREMYVCCRIFIANTLQYAYIQNYVNYL